ncbi:GrpB family protein [Shewanella halotolerans]|uniref:GrpB family protein n=1 Tax=Shewanella halotolerans TaxID=2864204 RepID=UPI001C65A01D|nr:GrpB family protein [Shewanella halotolerans]QYJ88395.1 GrpB family protein [Shewanella halotolerans]
MSRIFEVLDYQDHWPRVFEAEKALLQSVLGDGVITIEHIGSTSVPGLAAKPIIDILAEVERLDVLDALDAKNSELAKLGYRARGEHGIAGRRYFQKGAAQRSHHLHVFQSGSTQLTCHRAFRDYLIAHPDKAREYAELKRIAALSCHHDSEAYMAAKAGFIQETLALALCWYGKV